MPLLVASPGATMAVESLFLSELSLLVASPGVMVAVGACFPSELS